MHEYIENTLDGDLDLSTLNTVDFSRISASEIVKDALSDAFSVFERYYGEE